MPVYVPPKFESVLTSDNGIREDTSYEQLAALKPVFDRKYGSVTAGNSSPLTDGGACVLLMSEEKAKSLGYAPLGYHQVVRVRRARSGRAAAAGAGARRAGCAQARGADAQGHRSRRDARGVRRAGVCRISRASSRSSGRSAQGSRSRLARSTGAKLNVMGGSIAIGHPFGATGARITTTLLNELRRRGGQFGLMTVCAAGGMGFAMVVERTR